MTLFSNVEMLFIASHHRHFSAGGKMKNVRINSIYMIFTLIFVKYIIQFFMVAKNRF